MAGYFTDSSAAAKRYLDETGSEWLKSLYIEPHSNRFYAVAIISVEVVAAITRRARGSTITFADADVFCSLFLADLQNDYRILDITETLLRQAIYLARIYGLRGYDAVQLAAANEANALRLSVGLDPIIFLSADTELNTAAHAEGMTVDNPNTHL